MTILKKLKVIYWRALGHNKWHIALQALELQAKYASMTEQQRSVTMGEAVKLGLTLKQRWPPKFGQCVKL